MSPAPWRVLHVITRLDRGGSADNTLLTVTHMDRGRFVSTLAAGPGTGDPSLLLDGVRRQHVPMVEVPDLVRAVAPWRDVRALVRLWGMMRRGRFDLVHTHTSKAGLLGRLAAHAAGIPAVVHTPHGHVFYGYYGAAMTRMFILLERWASRITGRLVALTQREVDDYVALGVTSASRCVVIPSGVDFSPFRVEMRSAGTAREQLGIPTEAVVIGTVGRFSAVKGQRILLEAIARLHGTSGAVWLLLVGDGEERESLRALASDLGVAQRVIMPGWRQDVPFMLKAMDIFALPSHNEGMGKALVEAMFAGLPSVATQVGGVPEILQQGQHGLLVPAGDVHALGQALQDLIDHPERRRAMGRSAHRSTAGLSVERMVEQLETLYGELLHENRPD